MTPSLRHIAAFALLVGLAHSATGDPCANPDATGPDWDHPGEMECTRGDTRIENIRGLWLDEVAAPSDVFLVGPPSKWYRLCFTKTLSDPTSLRNPSEGEHIETLCTQPLPFEVSK